MSEKDVGIYSAAAKLVAQLVFVGHIITMTFYLALSKKIDEKSDTTEAFTSGLITILFSIALVLAIFVSLFANDIVSLIYGSKFDGASDILQILAWKWLFIIPAALYTRLLVLKGLTRYEFIKSLIVAGLSLSLNYLLIPHYGLSGAAYISVFSYFVADFLIYALFKATRPMFTTGFNAVVGLFIHPFKSMNNISLTLGSK
jgi:O-antigen/teichoic acid export membrane protein